MRKTMFLLVAFVVSVFTVNAQQKAYESTANLDKKVSGNSVSIEVMANVKDAQKLMYELLKKEDLKGKSSGRKISYEKIAFPALSTDYINLYISFEEKLKSKDNPITKVNVFVQKGIATSFESSSTDATLIENIKDFLNTKYVKEVYNANLEQIIENKNKEIKETQKELNKLEKSIEKRKKDIVGYEKDIEKAKKNIVEANSYIDSTTKQIAEVKQLLKKQNEELRNMK